MLHCDLAISWLILSLCSINSMTSETNFLAFSSSLALIARCILFALYADSFCRERLVANILLSNSCRRPESNIDIFRSDSEDGMLFEVKYLVMFVTLFLFSRMTYPKNRLKHVEKMSISENIENAGYGLFIFSTSVLLLLFACIYGACNFALNKLGGFKSEVQHLQTP